MDLQTWLQGKKTYIVLALAAFLHFAKGAGVEFGGVSAETLYVTLEPVLLALAAMFKMAADQRHELTKKDLTIVRLAKD